MSDNGRNVMQEQCRQIDGKIDRLTDDVGDLKRRTTAVEAGLAGQSRCLDCIERELDVIDQRLNGFGENAMPTSFDAP